MHSKIRINFLHRLGSSARITLSMDLASVVAALASVGVRVSGSTPNSSVQVDSSRACPTGLAGPEPSGTINDPGQHFHVGGSLSRPSGPGKHGQKDTEQKLTLRKCRGRGGGARGGGGAPPPSLKGFGISSNNRLFLAPSSLGGVSKVASRPCSSAEKTYLRQLGWGHSLYLFVLSTNEESIEVADKSHQCQLR